jgi:SAM-dependent methyltransferase
MIQLIKKVIKMFIPQSVYMPIINTYHNSYNYVVSLGYIGNKHECPLCKGRFSSLLPDVLPYSPVNKEKEIIGTRYILCPRCLSHDRERLLYLFIKKHKQEIFSRDIKLLHIAPEVNIANKLKSCSNIDYTSADLCAEESRIDIQMDITNIKQKDETYDVIICNHVLEHIEDDAKAMSELFRVLKKGGFAILQVPISYVIDKTFEDHSVTSSEEREVVFGQNDHVRIYGKDYIDRLENAGFSVTVHNFAESLSKEDIYKYRLIENEQVFIGHKA